jgi:hypothetical protein
MKTFGDDVALAFWAMSADYISEADLSFIGGLSANWQNTYTGFSTQSANNVTVYTSVNNSSANWQNTYTGFSTQSANNSSVYETVNSISATWGGGGGGSPTFLSGGTTNQILTKQSSTDYATVWKNKRTSISLGTISSTSTINCNALSADQFVVTLSGASVSATFNGPTNPYDAQIIMWNVRYQTNVASVALSSNVFRTPITTLNWSLSTNRMDIFAAKYNLLDSKWDVVSFAPGYLI